MGICCMIQGTQAWCSVTIQRGGMRRQMGGRFKREGTYVYLWLIRAAVWQKPTRYWKAIILQLKINKIVFKREPETRSALHRTGCHQASLSLSRNHEPGRSPRFSLVSPPRSQSFPGLASLTLPVGLSALEISLPTSKMFISWNVCTMSWKKDTFTKPKRNNVPPRSSTARRGSWPT